MRVRSSGSARRSKRCLEAALLHPRRHAGVEAGGAGRVGVDIGGDVEPLGARPFDRGHRVVEERPVGLAGRLEVVDLGPDVGFASDVDELVDGLDQVGALAAEVRDVHPVVLGDDLGERDEFVGVGKAPRRIDERRGDAHRALLHGGADDGPHLVELLRRRGPIVVADDVLAWGRGADERRDIRGDAALLEVPQVLVQRGPLDVVLDVALAADHLLLHGVVERAHGVALAHDLEGHALADVALRVAVLDERLGGPRQHVDESGRHGEPRTSISVRPSARPRSPMATIASPSMARSPTMGLDPLPS